MAPACEFDRLFTTNVLHIHEKIFLSLDCISFMNCLEVSRSWNDLLTSESFTIKGKALFSEDIRMELRFAARSGQSDMVRRILSSGMVSLVEMNNSTARRASPLLLATVYGHKNVVKLLLNGGAKPNKEDAKLKSTPLYEASKLGRLDLVKLLLDRGAKIDIKHPFKKCNFSIDSEQCPKTALLVAASNGHEKVVKVLLNRAAELKKATQYGCSALDIALHHAATSGHTNVVRVLCDMGAELNKIPQCGYNRRGINYGYNPLHMASWEGHRDVVQLLLDRGADPNLAMQNGVTPLQVAAGQGRKDVVQHLLERGADPDMADHFGNTALSLALEYSETDIVNILEEKALPSAM